MPKYQITITAEIEADSHRHAEQIVQNDARGFLENNLDIYIKDMIVEKPVTVGELLK